MERIPLERRHVWPTDLAGPVRLVIVGGQRTYVQAVRPAVQTVSRYPGMT